MNIHDDRPQIVYAFGHLVAAYHPEDAHSADSGDLAEDVLRDIGCTQQEVDLLEVIAAHVAHNYRYHGEEELGRHDL